MADVDANAVVFVGRARRRFSSQQITISLCVLIILAGLLVASPFLVLRALLLVNLIYAAGFFALRFVAITGVVLSPQRQAPPRAEPVELPRVTLLCPLYREANSVSRLIDSILRTDYPHDRLEVLILLEEDDDETEAGIRSLPQQIRVIRVPPGGPRTKPNALNHGLLEARGEIIGIYDAEDRPEPDQLTKVVNALAAGAPRLACVQARLNYYNRSDSIITRLFCLEYALQFDWFLRGLDLLDLPLPLGGTSNFVTREALLGVGGWDAHNVTEDADLGFRLYAAGFQTRTVDSTTFEEATDTPRRWVHQRSRWLKGYLQTFLVHLRSTLSWRAAIVLHFALGGVVLNALINPWMWIAFLAWTLTGAEALSPIFAGLERPLMMAFFAGNIGTAWLFIMAPTVREWFNLAPSGLLLPVYWVLQSVAAYKALYEFCVRPFYWDKTEHSEGEDSLREAAHA
ncbi:MAG: glycosyltransferase [Pseudomonadota bacterium]